MGASRSLLLAASALGLVVRLAFGLGYWSDQPLTRDEREYLSLARGLRRAADLPTTRRSSPVRRIRSAEHRAIPRFWRSWVADGR
jgi:hypothetical protein